MAEWSLMDREWPTNRRYDPFSYVAFEPYSLEGQLRPLSEQCLTPHAQPYHSLPKQQTSPTQKPLLLHLQHLSLPPLPHTAAMHMSSAVVLRGDNPREIRNKAEKQRRDKLNQSISELAAIVPPVVAASRKIDKTGVLRLTAHYLRAHHYVFGDSIGQTTQEINSASAQALLQLLNGFLLTTTYKGIIVVVSQNIQQYLGYTELDLLGQNIFNITHKDDHELLKEQLMPKRYLLGPNGELLFPDEPDGKQKVAEALAHEKRRFLVRFKKLNQRSEPSQYITCHVEGSLRKSDRACRRYNRCCQMVRRARARADNPCSSGNDVVFISVVRPTTETFITESEMESYWMEYRTRHSIDGEIIQCEQKIALVTGYMTHEVNGVNAMNFMHRDDVRWVIIALREMYDQNRLFGESCYRLIMKNGQFIYMRTRGRLEVNHNSREVTSFICTNTVVNEEEGKHLIKLMKKKFTLMVNNNEEPPQEEDNKELDDNQQLPVEDPRQLEKVILHLVTNLPSPQPETRSRSVSPERCDSPPLSLVIIPPTKEKIVSAIEKVYSVLKNFIKAPSINMKSNRGKQNKISTRNQQITNNDQSSPEESPLSYSSNIVSSPGNSSQYSDHLIQVTHRKPLPDYLNLKNFQASNGSDLNIKSPLCNTSKTLLTDYLNIEHSTSSNTFHETYSTASATGASRLSKPSTSSGLHPEKTFSDTKSSAIKHSCLKSPINVSHSLSSKPSSVVYSEVPSLGLSNEVSGSNLNSPTSSLSVVLSTRKTSSETYSAFATVTCLNVNAVSNTNSPKSPISANYSTDQETASEAYLNTVSKAYKNVTIVYSPTSSLTSPTNVKNSISPVSSSDNFSDIPLMSYHLSPPNNPSNVKCLVSPHRTSYSQITPPPLNDVRADRLPDKQTIMTPQNFQDGQKTVAQPETNIGSTSIKIKRPFVDECTNKNILNSDKTKRKKVIRPNSNEESQSIENLFDETIFNDQFPNWDINVNLLEQTIDPTFPDLLGSRDIDDYLNPTHSTSESSSEDERQET